MASKSGHLLLFPRNFYSSTFKREKGKKLKGQYLLVAQLLMTKLSS